MLRFVGSCKSKLDSITISSGTAFYLRRGVRCRNTTLPGAGPLCTVPFVNPLWPTTNGVFSKAIQESSCRCSSDLTSGRRQPSAHRADRRFRLGAPAMILPLPIDSSVWRQSGRVRTGKGCQLRFARREGGNSLYWRKIQVGRQKQVKSS